MIQQTSLAPVVIQILGEVYARAFGINYVYALWALVYETVFVVFLSITLAELLFPGRKDEPWMSRAGIFVSVLLFAAGSLLAWYSWTQIARPLVFKVPLYSPTPLAIALALLAIMLLVTTALGPARRLATVPAKPPLPWLSWASPARSGRRSGMGCACWPSASNRDSRRPQRSAADWSSSS